MNEANKPAADAGPVDLGLVPAPEPAGFRTRYRSEPGMIGHYPWTYYEPRRRSVDRPELETEALYTADQVSAMLAAERERLRAAVEAYFDAPARSYLQTTDQCDAQAAMWSAFDGPNVGGEARLAAHRPSHTTTATPQGVDSTDQLGGRARSEKD